MHWNTDTFFISKLADFRVVFNATPFSIMRTDSCKTLHLNTVYQVKTGISWKLNKKTIYSQLPNPYQIETEEQRSIIFLLNSEIQVTQVIYK